MSDQCNESSVEEAALSWFDELGYAVLHAPAIAPGKCSTRSESSMFPTRTRRDERTKEEAMP